MNNPNDGSNKDDGGRVYSAEEQAAEVESNQDVVFRDDGTKASDSAGH